MRRTIFIIFFCCIITNIISQQPDSSWFKEYRTVVPGLKYEAGWLHKVFFGSHWRDVWTTPVRVPVVDINKYGGGLTPLRKGGGLQTKSLRLKGKDGIEYKFRSLNKDPRLTMPPELRESIVYDVMNDQMCSSNPYSGFVVSRILDDFDIIHAEFSLVILPDDPALGLYRSEFADNVGIMEIVPEPDLYEGSDKVINTVKLLDRLNNEFDETIDSPEFLKARLLDIFTGNWDRHKDQWKWIRFEDGNKKFYKPYPMDFDEAFDNLDGLLPFIASQNVEQLNHFGYSYPNMRFLTWSGRYIDQRFLAFMTKDEWDMITDNVINKLSNQLIDDAVKKLPPEVYNIAEEELVGKLKSRRNGLKKASQEFYELVNSVIDIYTTDKDDYILISPSESVHGSGINIDKSIVISFYKRNNENIYESSVPVLQKYIDMDNTNEIRIYLQDGDDKVFISEEISDIPVIRIVGGGGRDEIVNKSDESVSFYDDGKKSSVSGKVSVDDKKFKFQYEDLLKEYKAKKDALPDFKKDLMKESIDNMKYDPVIPPDKFYKYSYIPDFSFSPDFGPYFGAKFNYYKYGFRMNPYLYRLQFVLGYAPDKRNVKGLVAVLNSDFRGIVKNSSLNFYLRKSGIELNNFFGMGNNTVYFDSLSKTGYYKIHNEKYTGELGIIYPADNKLKFNLGIRYNHFRIEDIPGTISNSISFDSAGRKNVNIPTVKAGIELDGRDHYTSPYSGYYLNLAGSYSPKLFNDNYEFGRLTGDLRGYIGYKTTISLALWFRGEKIIGNKFPFFESAFLGGSGLLRGFPSERFAGDGSVMTSAELRFRLFRYNFLIPQTLGLFGFGETGRVFLKDADSKQWHTSYGAGLFIHFINRDVTFRFTYAASAENKFLFYFNTGFGF